MGFILFAAEPTVVSYLWRFNMAPKPSTKERGRIRKARGAVQVPSFGLEMTILISYKIKAHRAAHKLGFCAVALHQ